EGWRLGGVVETAEHDGPIGVSSLEADDDLGADPRHELGAPAGSRPALHRAHPTRVLALTVPMEADLHRTRALRVDTIGSDDDRGEARLDRDARWALGHERHGRGHAPERVLVEGLVGAAAVQ